MKAGLITLLLLVCVSAAGQGSFTRSAYERRVEELYRDWDQENEKFFRMARQKMEARSRPVNLINLTDTMAIHRARQKEDSIGRRWEAYRQYRVFFPDSSNMYLQAYYEAKKNRLKLQIRQGEEEIRITDYLLKRADSLFHFK